MKKEKKYVLLLDSIQHNYAFIVGSLLIAIAWYENTVSIPVYDEEITVFGEEMYKLDNRLDRYKNTQFKHDQTMLSIADAEMRFDKNVYLTKELVNNKLDILWTLKNLKFGVDSMGVIFKAHLKQFNRLIHLESETRRTGQLTDLISINDSLEREWDVVNELYQRDGQDRIGGIHLWKQTAKDFSLLSLVLGTLLLNVNKLGKYFRGLLKQRLTPDSATSTEIPACKFVPDRTKRSGPR